MHSVAVVLARLLLLVSLARFGECQLVSWLSDTTNETLASFVTLAGNLSIDSVFQLKNDLPEQHAALKVLYEATGGPNWSSTYSSDVNLEGLAQYAAAVGTGKLTQAIIRLKVGLLASRLASSNYLTAF